jgi:transcriptional regulator with XRE-family HTH domain
VIQTSVRTATDFRAAREVLGLSADALARMLNVDDGRTIRRWEAGERELPGPVIVMMETALSYLRKIELISQQIEEFTSGKMRIGTTTINGEVDDTKDTIIQLTAAKKSYQEAFEELTRQPPPDESESRVHWYHLRRLTPKYNPKERDDWSLPGELSPQAALFYFERHEGLGGLELCENNDLSADFILEKKNLIRRRHGASQRLSAGDLVETFFVRSRHHEGRPFA